MMHYQAQANRAWVPSFSAIATTKHKDEATCIKLLEKPAE
jgi:hypothetical protein